MRKIARIRPRLKLRTCSGKIRISHDLSGVFPTGTRATKARQESRRLAERPVREKVCVCVCVAFGNGRIAGRPSTSLTWGPLVAGRAIRHVLVRKRRPRLGFGRSDASLAPSLAVRRRDMIRRIASGHRESAPSPKPDPEKRNIVRIRPPPCASARLEGPLASVATTSRPASDQGAWFQHDDAAPWPAFGRELAQIAPCHVAKIEVPVTFGGTPRGVWSHIIYLCVPR